MRPRSSTYSSGGLRKGKAWGRPSTCRRGEVAGAASGRARPGGGRPPAGGGRRQGRAGPAWPGPRAAHRDLPARQQLHSHVPQLHGHRLRPGHAASAPGLVGHVHAAA